MPPLLSCSLFPGRGSFHFASLDSYLRREAPVVTPLTGRLPGTCDIGWYLHPQYRGPRHRSSNEIRSRPQLDGKSTSNRPGGNWKVLCTHTLAKIWISVSEGWPVRSREHPTWTVFLQWRADKVSRDKPAVNYRIDRVNNFRARAGFIDFKWNEWDGGSRDYLLIPGLVLRYLFHYRIWSNMWKTIPVYNTWPELEMDWPSRSGAKLE